MAVQKSNVQPGPLAEATTPPMYVMVDMSHFAIEPIGGDMHQRLRITKLPYCWHIGEKELGSEWAIILAISHGQSSSTTRYELSLAQCDGGLTPCASGGGPTREVAVELTKRINELLDQFLRPPVLR